MNLNYRILSLILGATTVVPTALSAAEGADEEGSVSISGLLNVSESLRSEKRAEARKGAWPVTVEMGLGAGWNSNIYDGWAGQEVDSALIVGAAKLGLEHRFTAQDRWRINGQAQGKWVAEDSTANVSEGRVETDWQHKFSPAVTTMLQIGADVQNDTALTALGTELTRDEDFLAYNGRGSIDIDLTSSDNVETGVLYRRKNYVETPGLNTLDWDQFGGQLRYRHRSDWWTARLWYEVVLQTYDEEPSSDQSGVELTTNPTEEHLHQTALVWWSAQASKHTEIDLKVKYSMKDDQFEGYESWSEWRASAGISCAITAVARLGLDGWYAKRDYDNRAAAPGETLEYDKYGIEGWARFNINQHWSIALIAQVVDRDTNKDTGTAYRDYTVIEMIGGVSAAY